jgi:hypothetical protein
LETTGAAATSVAAKAVKIKKPARQSIVPPGWNPPVNGIPTSYARWAAEQSKNRWSGEFSAKVKQPVNPDISPAAGF